MSCSESCIDSIKCNVQSMRRSDTKSTKGNVTYLGNPYQLYWNDYGCKRGFHVFDTETLKTTFYRNPFDMFHKLYYNNGLTIPDNLGGTFVKLIVEEKGDYAKFDYTVSQLQDTGIADLKIIEDLSVELGESEVLETEDTMTLLDKYIDDIDLKVDVSSVKNISAMFYGCTKFNQSLEKWNVSNVEDMGRMFFGCKNFNQPLEKWNVSNVRNMEEMFYICAKFNQPLNDWDVSNVEYMYNMFEGCDKFHQPLYKWDGVNIICFLDVLIINNHKII